MNVMTLDSSAVQPGTPTIDPLQLGLPCRARLLSHPKVKPLVAALLAAQAKYWATLDPLEAYFSPRDWQKVAAELVGQADTPDELELLLREVATSQVGEAVVGRAKALGMKALDEFAEAFPPLFAVCREALVALKLEAEQHERKLFSAFGLPVEETSVRRRLKALETQISDWERSLAGLAQPGLAPHRSALGHIVDFFQDGAAPRVQIERPKALTWSGVQALLRNTRERIQAAAQ